MTTELPPVTVQTPANVSVIRTTVKRSWKARILIIANALVSFVIALLGYLQTINLANFGITADRVAFYMALIGLVQFVLIQVNPVKLLNTHVEPGGSDSGERG